MARWAAFVCTTAEDETKLARTIAALLVEAAMADGEVDHAEYSHIRHMLVTQLDLAADEASAMLDDSVASHDDRIEIHSLTRHIRNDTDAAVTTLKADDLRKLQTEQRKMLRTMLNIPRKVVRGEGSAE